MSFKDIIKQKKIIIPLVILLFLVVTVLVTFSFLNTPVTKAVVYPGSDTEIQLGSSGNWIPAKESQKLNQYDSIKTGEQPAKVILYESLIVNLDPHTEISLEQLSKENIVVNQKSGYTWNKFANILGIGQVNIKTPNTVATVRGTEFGVGMYDVSVGEGEVEVTDNSGNKFLLKTARKVVRDKSGNFVEREIDLKELKEIRHRMQRSLKDLKDLRMDFINKHETSYNIAKRLANVDDDTVRKLILDADEGRLNLTSIEAKVPSALKKVSKRPFDLTKKIKKQIIAVKTLDETIERKSKDLNNSNSNNHKICTMEYMPVCGVDGHTYSNKCVAGDIKIAHMGKC